MPRKYHRPPAAKRRKAKKRAASTSYAETVPVAEEAFGRDVAATELEEPLEETAPSLLVREAGRASQPEPKSVTHITHDYSYVRTEIVRIAAIAIFLVVALVITSILR